MREIRIILMVTLRDLPDIKLIRTDTTLDLSHVAEKIECD